MTKEEFIKRLRSRPKYQVAKYWLDKTDNLIEKIENKFNKRKNKVKRK